MENLDKQQEAPVTQRSETLLEKHKRLADELKNVEDELRVRNTKEAWNHIEVAQQAIEMYEAIMSEYNIGTPLKKSVGQFRATAQELHNFIVMVAERKV